jgi:hypothetical protein
VKKEKMKIGYLHKVVVILAVIVAIQSSFRTPDPSGMKDGNGFAVLELFTSEGCSSCPPADELLAKIQQETAGKPVYLLAYHVDYWDRLGWKDAFSNAEYSNRQLQYGRWLNVSPIYTPQVVVNGKSQFVGSEAADIRHAISEQLSVKPVATLTIQASREGEHLNIKYRAIHVNSGSRVLIVVVQKSAQSKVLRGENAGHLLSHIQIVRKLQTGQLNTSGDGNAVVELPKDFNASNGEIVGFVQDQGSGEILAVAKADL